MINIRSHVQDEKVKRNGVNLVGNKDEVNMDRAKTHVIYECMRKKISSEIIRGIIVSESINFLMLNKIVDGFFFDGYTIIRKCDISDYRFYDKENFIERQIQHAIGLKASPPKIMISLKSMKEIISSLNNNDKLFSIEKEYSYRNILWLTKVQKISSFSFLADELNSNGEWERHFRHYFSSITKIEFDSRYINLYEKLFAIR